MIRSAALTIAISSLVGISFASQVSANADITGVATCLYGGPSWMSTWTVSTPYPYSIYGPGLERTHQFNEEIATLEVIVNIGTPNAPEYVTVTSTINRPADCTGIVTSPDTTPPPVVDEEEHEEHEKRYCSDERRERRNDHSNERRGKYWKKINARWR